MWCPEVRGLYRPDLKNFTGHVGLQIGNHLGRLSIVCQPQQISVHQNGVVMPGHVVVALVTDEGYWKLTQALIGPLVDEFLKADSFRTLIREVNVYGHLDVVFEESSRPNFSISIIIRVAFRVLSPPGHLPTLVGGGYTCIVKQRNSNVTWPVDGRQQFTGPNGYHRE